ncbi:MAG: DUF3576 domain-containing protein [Magnetococcales bacterium]|nr:DUF3576 domain-containing protein [Magnetococcales bacterium]
MNLERGRQIMKGKVWVVLGSVLTLGLVGCSQDFWNSRNKLDEHPLAKFGQKKVLDDAKASGSPNSAAEAGEESIFSLGGKEGGLFSSGTSKRKEQVRADKLFAGALDVVIGLPIQVANREGGLVSTDWKIDPQNNLDRYRLNILVSGKDPYGEVKVAVLKQSLRNGVWEDATADQNMADHIAKKIRKQAEEARP